MYSVRCDTGKNRLYVTVEGSLNLDEMPKYSKEFGSAIDKLKPGFTVLVDNTKATVNSQQVSEKLNESRDYAVAKGLKNSAIVVNSTLFKMQMKRLFNELGNVFDSVADADKFLNSAPDIRK